MGNHDERAPYAAGLFGEEPTTRPAGPGARRRRAADRRPRHQRARLPPRRADRRPAGLARRRARDAGPARHDAGDAPPADPGADAARRPRSSSCSTRTGSPRCSRAPTCAASSAATSTSRRTRPSPASRCRWPSATCYTTDPAPLDRLHLGRRRPPGVQHGARVRRPRRAHDRPDRRGARGERLPRRRARAGRGAHPRGAAEIISRKDSSFYAGNEDHSPRGLPDPA